MRAFYARALQSCVGLLLLASILGCGIVDMAIADVEWLLGYESATPAEQTTLPGEFSMFDPMLEGASKYSMMQDKQCILIDYSPNVFLEKPLTHTELYEMVEKRVLSPQGFHVKQGSLDNHVSSYIYTKEGTKESWHVLAIGDRADRTLVIGRPNQNCDSKFYP